MKTLALTALLVATAMLPVTAWIMKPAPPATAAIYYLPQPTPPACLGSTVWPI